MESDRTLTVVILTPKPPTWKLWWATNASKWQTRFNSVY
jgi:hypothetical protein